MSVDDEINEEEFEVTFEFDETPIDQFTKTEGVRADDYEAFVESGGEERKDDNKELLAAKPPWRNSKALLKLKKQINAAYPKRKKASDGHIGNDAHCPNSGHTGSSDHCLNITDGNYKVVTAMDITHDPVNCDVDGIVESIRGSEDSRIKYIIWNKRICNHKSIDGKPAWAWRPYVGSNDHTKHAHFSVKGDKSYYDDVSAWTISSSPLVG